MTSTWRQIVDLKNMDGCAALGESHPLNFINQAIKFVRYMVPGAIADKCPVQPGKFHVNQTITSISFKSNFTSSLSSDDYPNGRYRVYVHVFNKDDPVGITFWLMFEFYVRNNAATDF